jgi:ankyrin repeat protein
MNLPSGLIYGLVAEDPPIFRVIERGECAELEALIRSDSACVTARMKDPDQTPLMVAARMGRDDLCDLLLRAAAPVDAANRFGQTALSFALEVGADGLAIRLIESGAGPSTIESGGSTPLHIAAQYAGPGAVKALMAAGAEAEAKRFNGATPAIMAAFAGRVDNVRALAEGGAEIVDARCSINPGGASDSCLTIAADRGDGELLSYLLAAFAWPPEAKNQALKRAARGGYLPIAEALVAQGADPFAIAGASEKSALDLARQRKQKAVVDYFKTLKA